MVKSVIMVVFREGKSQDEEMKYWNFWHSRQHSVKQRILDADTKNSVGLTHPIEEISHNALAVYWNPFESAAKVSYFLKISLLVIKITLKLQFDRWNQFQNTLAHGF